MELVAPDILGDIRQLSAVFSAAALLVGVVLWVAGWATHRFWIVLTATILGGIGGLQHAAELRATPLLAAIGIGLAAGLLALTVIRLGAFFAGGLAALALVHSWVPHWDQPLVTFLAGGLVGWFLFRYWTMALTSLAGVLLTLHGGLALADKWGKIDAVAWSETNASLLNGVGGSMVLAGFAVQLLGSWLRSAPAGDDSKKDKKDEKKGKSGGALLTAGLAAFRRAG